MLQLILNNYLTIRSRKLQNLTFPTNNTNVQQQKSSYLATGPFRKNRQPTKVSRPKQNWLYRSKNQSESHMSNTKKDFSKKSNNIRQFTSSKPEWYSTSYEPTLPLPVLSRLDIPVGERLLHFVEQWGELNQIKWVLPIVQESFRPNSVHLLLYL